MIKFNEPFYTGNEISHIQALMATKKLQGSCDENKSTDYLKQIMQSEEVFLVHSCTAALEIAALALDIKPGDEVIMPSYTYVSTANAFVLRGAKIIFVDVDEKTMNIDLVEVEKAITPQTKVIVPVHYGGVSCDMAALLVLANKHDIVIVEDAAQALFSKYQTQYLGTIGHLGCVSLHETKNITAGGEGGILFVNDKKLVNKIKMIVEKGTNRSEFLSGRINKYTWQTVGSSYLMSQLNAGFFMAQIEGAHDITKRRTAIFKSYLKGLADLIDNKRIETLEIPAYNEANGHLFYIKTRDESERNQLKNFLKSKHIESTSHYEPLHSSVAGKKYGTYVGTDRVTSKDSKRLLRLPLHMHLSNADVEEVIMRVKEFYDDV